MDNIRRRDSRKPRRNRKLHETEKEITIGSMNKSLSKDENNEIIIIIEKMKLLLLNDSNNPIERAKHAIKIRSLLENIFGSPTHGETFIYFLEHGAATSWLLQINLEMPEASAYRALKRMRALKLIEPAIRVSKIRNSKGGPRPTIWVLKGSSHECVARALQLHYRSLSPKFRVAEQVAQSILEDYLFERNLEEITYKEIVLQVRELHVVYRTGDIAEMAATILNEKGIKVWR